MASNIYINEYANLGATANFDDLVAAPYCVPIATQQVAISGSSVASAAFNARTFFVMINASAACSLAWGTAPTAVATAERMSAGETRFYTINPGQKVAVITNTDT